MTDSELRVYAARALTTRLAELEAERAHLTRLLAEFSGTVDAGPAPPGSRRTISTEGRQRIAAAARQRWAKQRAQQEEAAADAAQAEPARILPRRGRSLQRASEVPQEPALPPMPRLVKARAS